jgi:hypothetical protein
METPVGLLDLLGSFPTSSPESPSGNKAALIHQTLSSPGAEPGHVPPNSWVGGQRKCCCFLDNWDGNDSMINKLMV